MLVIRRLNKFFQPAVRSRLYSQAQQDHSCLPPVLYELTQRYKENESLFVSLWQTNQTSIIQNTSIDRWNHCLDTFKDTGFTLDETVQIINKYPDILKVIPLQQRLTRWFNCNFGIDLFTQIIQFHPEFLTVDVRDINERLPLIFGLATTKKKVAILLMNCPNVLFDKWSDILSKVKYLEKEMRLKDEDIVNSQALAYPLLHIKIRHKYLERCGVYIKPKLHEKNPLNKPINPPLKRIVDNSDISFVKRISGTTLEEYEMFKESYPIELKALDEEYISGDDTDDDEIH